MNPQPRKVDCSFSLVAEPNTPPEEGFLPHPTNDADKIAPGLYSEAGLEVYTPHIHSTNIKTRALCRRRFLFAHRLGLVRKGFHSPLQMGALYHKIMRHLYLGGDTEAAVDASQYWIDDEIVALAKAYGTDRGTSLGAQSIREIQDDAQSDLDKAQAMAIVSWRDHPLDRKAWEVIAVEEPLHLVSTSFPLPTTVSIMIDLLLRDRASGEGWIVDHKTTSMSPIKRAAMLQFDCQPRLYRLGATAAYPDIPIVGAIFSIIRKPTIKYCGKDKTFEDYIDRMGDWYTVQRQKNPSDPPYVAPHIRFVEPVMTEELLDQLHDAHESSQCSVDLINFPRTANTEQICDGKYGLCPFASLCTSSSDAWSTLIPDLYVQVNRDATEK